MSTFQKKSEAILEADRLAASKKYEATRVQEEKNEKVLYTAEPPAVQSMSVGTITSAPVCGNLIDTWSAQARLMGAALMRPYLDQNELICGDLWFRPFVLMRLSKEDKLIQLAVVTIAKLQAAELECDSSERSKMLYEFIDQQQSALAALPDLAPYIDVLKANGITSLVTRAKEDPHIKAELLIRAALYEYAGQMPEADRKLDLILDLFNVGPVTVDSSVYLDEAISDILSNGKAMQSVLGHHPNRGAALVTLANIWRGTAEQSPQPVLRRLNAIVGRYPMPMVQSILEDRICKELNGTSPFQDDPNRESDAFESVLKSMVTPSGLIGDERVVTAITRRAQISLKQSYNDLTIPEAIEAVINMMPHKRCKAKYLSDLLHCETLKDSRFDIITPMLETIGTKIKNVAAICTLGADRATVQSEIQTMIDRIAAAPLDLDKREQIVQNLKDNLHLTLNKKPLPSSPSTQSSTGQMSQKTFYAGDTIFQEGDAGDSAFLINSGKVAIVKKRNNEEIVLGHLGKGDFFGEMALVDNEPRMATARAVEDTTVTPLPQAAFRQRLDRLEESDRVMRKIMDVFVNRIRSMAERTN